MLEIFSKKIATWLIKSGILENDNTELYGYAIQYLLLIIIPTINFFAYCIATHNIIIGLIILFSFLLIRKYSGGYHCKSSTVCLIFSTIILIFMAWLSNRIRFSLSMIIVLLLCESELILRGPIISINHSVSHKEKKFFHKCLFLILIVYDVLLFVFWNSNMTHYANCIFIVITVCSIAHIASGIGKNRERYY